MTKTALFASLLTISLAACGSVEPTGVYGDDGSDTGSDDGSDGTDQPDGGMPSPDAPPAPTAALMFGAVQSATTPTAISAIDNTTNAAVLDLINGTGTARDVAEQRITTLIDGTIDLRVRLTGSPSIAITRKIVTDIGDEGPTISPDTAHREWCTTRNNTIFLDNPLCNTTRPVDSSVEQIATSTTATYSAWIYDEASMQTIACATDATGMACVLPGQANHSYRIVIAVNKIAELWDGSALALRTSQGREYLGHTITQPYCWDEPRDSVTQNYYCNARFDYSSPVGLEKATMTFTGIAFTVTANGDETPATANAMTWDYGDADFPGPTY